MQFGNLSGLVNGTEQIVFDYEVTGSAVSSISTGNILNGNEDGWYTIIIRFISGAATEGIYFRPNNDSGTNYGYRLISATNTTVADYNATGRTGFIFGRNGTSTNNSSLIIARMYAKSGSVRLMNYITVDEITGTTVTNVNTGGQVWSDTSNNISSATFASIGGGTSLNIGTRIIILKSNNFTNGTPTGVITTPYIKGAWVRVGSQVLGADSGSVTFSGLDGDRDVLYFVKATVKATGASIGTSFQVNSDTAANYGYQALIAANTTVSAARDTGATRFLQGWTGTASGNYHHGSALIFAKSGFVRPAISSVMENVTGTTVTTIMTLGHSWNNTGSNITSITFPVAGNNYAAGSQFDLYALRPNG